MTESSYKPGELQAVAVFCGSSLGAREAYADAAQALGVEMARRGIAAVYGGANRGLMGAFANACLEAGGSVTGVLPRALKSLACAHKDLTAIHLVDTMHERKAMMAGMVDAFIALPGGFGTLDELFEAATWSQLGIHAKPCGLLNVEGYFTYLAAFLDHITEERLVRPEHRTLITCSESPSALLDALARFVCPRCPKFID